MKVKIKKLVKEAQIPAYAKPGDAGMDLTAVSRVLDEDGCLVYGTGLAFEIPEGYVGLIFPRSSNAKKDLTLTNSVGVVDSGYRGEVMLKFKPLDFFSGRDAKLPLKDYEVGERVGQLIVLPHPKVEFEEVFDLSVSERGEGGYGSTGTHTLTTHVQEAIFADEKK